MNLINHHLLFFLVLLHLLLVIFLILIFLSFFLSLLHDSHGHSHSMQTPGESPIFLSPLLSILLSNQPIVTHPHPSRPTPSDQGEKETTHTYTPSSFFLSHPNLSISESHRIASSLHLPITIIIMLRYIRNLPLQFRRVSS